MKKTQFHYSLSFGYSTPPYLQWSLHPLHITSRRSVGLRQISPVPGGQSPPQWGTNGRCSTIVEESNGLTNGLSFLLQKFDAQKIKVVG